MERSPSDSYSLTLRVKLSTRAGTLGEVATAIGKAGGDIEAEAVARDVEEAAYATRVARRDRAARGECNGTLRMTCSLGKEQLEDHGLVVNQNRRSIAGAARMVRVGCESHAAPE